jgi:gamma-glutamylcyclotransferase (GGCT)/AIG2-like uncharacterized protein YtfP
MMGVTAKPGRPGWSSAAHAIVDRVFVYGTLRQGQTARSMIANHVVSSEPATVPGRIYAFPLGHPGLVQPYPDQPRGGALVVGELLRLSDLPAALALLDAYEGEDFARVLSAVTRADGSTTYAWVYVLADPASAEHGELIASGDWVEYWESSEG